jgi:hypothetical protein
MPSDQIRVATDVSRALSGGCRAAQKGVWERIFKHLSADL